MADDEIDRLTKLVQKLEAKIEKNEKIINHWCKILEVHFSEEEADAIAQEYYGKKLSELKIDSDRKLEAGKGGWA